MHIALPSSDLPDSGAPTGQVTYTKIMRDSLRDLGHDVSIIAGNRLLDPEGRLHILPDPGRLRGLALRRYDRLVPHGGIGQAGFDAVRNWILAAYRIAGFETLEMEEAFGTVAAVIAARRFPVIVRLHGPFIHTHDPPAGDAARRRVRRRIADEGRGLAAAAGVTSPSGRLLEAVCGHYGITPRLSAVIPNPMAAAPETGRWRLDRCDPKQLLFIGRFDRLKGADVVLAAFARAARSDPGLSLVMAGVDAGIAAEDGRIVRFAEYLQAHVPQELHHRIRYLGPIAPDEVRALRFASGLAIVASRSETFAYIIAESMAVGAPTIASATFSELLDDGESGLVYPAGDAAALADDILALTADPYRMAAIGDHAWERCRGLLDPMRIAADTAAFHARVAGGWRR